MSDVHEFRVSSFCSGGSCVSVADTGGAIMVAHSGNADAVVGFTREEWSAFVQGVKAGEFDV